MAETYTFDRLKLDFGGNILTDTALVPLNVPLALQKAIALAAGSGADAANLAYMARLTLAAATAVTLDLAGSLLTPSGAPFLPSKIRAMLFFLYAGANCGPLLVGGHATAAFRSWLAIDGSTFDIAQPKLRVRNGASGGLFLLTGTDSTGLVVTPATEDTLEIYNEGSASCTFDVVLLGA